MIGIVEGYRSKKEKINTGNTAEKEDN